MTIIKDERYELFDALNDKLRSVGETLCITCVGGYVLELHDIKATKDVDAFYRNNVTINRLIKQVGDEYGANSADDDWLNNSVGNVNAPPSKDECQLLYEFSNLEVYIASLEYVLCMKLCTDREKDIDDAAKILNRLKDIDDPIKLYNILIAHGFNRSQCDISRVLDAFERLLGTDWLERYYREHERELYNLL